MQKLEALANSKFEKLSVTDQEAIKGGWRVVEYRCGMGPSGDGTMVHLVGGFFGWNDSKSKWNED